MGPEKQRWRRDLRSRIRRQTSLSDRRFVDGHQTMPGSPPRTLNEPLVIPAKHQHLTLHCPVKKTYSISSYAPITTVNAIQQTTKATHELQCYESRAQHAQSPRSKGLGIRFLDEHLCLSQLLHRGPNQLTRMVRSEIRRPSRNAKPARGDLSTK